MPRRAVADPRRPARLPAGRPSDAHADLPCPKAAPPPPEWLIEHGIGTSRPAVRLHTAQCWDTRAGCTPTTADTARRALAEGVPACPHCRAGTALDILD
ncbi:DUF6233 domain-containing protein [Streptomyces sp. NPDC057939]|uniref:DUF6233 domain-containing protein n=1 Tax=Streptomyces sp. NPDC057939 TaxID=3346284 RepID=UPI0036E04F1C